MIAEMTNQEIFDEAAKHLLRMGRRCQEDKLPVYKHSFTGQTCPVGYFMVKDSLYFATMEHWDLESLVNWGYLPGWEEKWRLLKELQFVHDCRSPLKWSKALKRVAKKFRLSSRVLNNE